MQQILYLAEYNGSSKVHSVLQSSTCRLRESEEDSPGLAPVKRPGKEDFPASWPTRDRSHGDQPIKTKGKVLFSSFGRGIRESLV